MHGIFSTAEWLEPIYCWKWADSEVEQWQGEPVQHWSVFTLCCGWATEGRGTDFCWCAACETPLQHQIWLLPEKKPCSFLSLITKTVYSWVHDTRLVLVSWSVLQAKEILGSKSNKSYEGILVLWFQWRAGHNRAIAHSATACLDYVDDIFLLYFECVPEPQKKLSFFFLASKHIEKWTQTRQTFMSSFVRKCREFLIPYWVYFQYCRLETEGNYLLHIKIMCEIDFHM